MYYKETEAFKISILEDPTFLFADAFGVIDLENTGYIDFENLKRFLTHEMGKEPTEDVVINIIRRLDKDDDGRLSYNEFVEGIRPRDPGLQDMVDYKLKPRVIQRDDFLHSSRRSLRKLKTSQQETFETQQAISSERFRSSSPKRNFASPTKVLTSPLRTTAPGSFVRRAEYYSSPKTYTKSSTVDKKPKLSTIKKKSALTSTSKKKDIMKQSYSEDLSQTWRDSDWFKDLMRIFREIINLEKELEIVKEDLCLRKDFNLFDAFRHFDKRAHGSITVGDVEEGLAELDIYPNREDLYLFVRRFDRDADGRLRYNNCSTNI